MKHHRPEGEERRKHPRFPVVDNLIEPITLRYTAQDGKKAPSFGKEPKVQPAILTNLSAGGMSILTFVEPPHAKAFEMDLRLPGLHAPVEAKVVRVHSKGETHNVGIEFTRIQKKHQSQINEMANHNLDCETRISLGLPEVCVKDCTFHQLCHKQQKSPHWPPKA